MSLFAAVVVVVVVVVVELQFVLFCFVLFVDYKLQLVTSND